MVHCLITISHEINRVAAFNRHPLDLGFHFAIVRQPLAQFAKEARYNPPAHTIAPIKPFERARAFRIGQAGAVVLDSNAHAGARLLDGDGDASTPRRELARVVDEVGQRARQPQRIGGHSRDL